MLDTFIKQIDDLYEILLQPIDSMYKIIAINKLKAKINMTSEEGFGERYTKLLVKIKNSGSVYTPLKICDFLVRNTISKESVISDPYIKIMDPACGSGNFIFSIFNWLKEIYLENCSILSINKESINKHIIDNNLLGMDVDETALKILNIDLFKKTQYINPDKFLKRDFLTTVEKITVDYIIGNPPYIGHKAISREYAAILKKLYRDIYKDKGDISYCFFEKGINILNEKGKLTFIVSRYFIESQSGEELRRFLKEESSLYRIVDFYGLRPFKGIGIDPVIIFTSKEKQKVYSVKVNKPLKYNPKGLNDLINNDDCALCNNFSLENKYLHCSGWILKDEHERRILDKIEKKCCTSLQDVCQSFQGIITGCDKAFIIDKETMIKNCIEDKLVMPWIKSTLIEKYKVKENNLFLIYSNFIKKEEDYPYSINYIGKMKDKLITRRECLKNMRKWYELQWGRKFEDFEGKKIVFPYKSEENRFAFDEGSFYSADVYGLKLKEDSVYSYEFLLSILNSDVYDFYFKSFGKKLGERMYEYYPNTVMKLMIPKMAMNKNLDLYKFFELTKEEIEIIKKA